MPKPLQPGGVPIWVSGTINARVVDRLCRFGLRWIPWGDDAAEIEQSIATMRERIAAAGVTPDGLAGRRQPARLQDRRRQHRHRAHDGTRYRGLVAAGATDLRVRLPVREPDAETEDSLRDFVAAFRVAAGRDDAPVTGEQHPTTEPKAQQHA